MRQRAGWKTVQLDEVAPRPWQDTAWLPLREALGTRIVGMAAFTADRVGKELIEGHDEGHDGRGHEEVYVVLRGRATFVLSYFAAARSRFARLCSSYSRCASASASGS